VSSWIEVDRAGFAQIVADRPKSFILFELIQNALDEPGVTTVDVTVTHEARGLHRVCVQDDARDGYSDIRHAWTLYAPSKKKSDPTKRGRFNSGCKSVLALAKSARVVSTAAAVEFDPERGRRTLRRRTERGTVFDGWFSMSIEEADEAVAEARKMLPPPGVELTIDGVRVYEAVPDHVLEAQLPTIISDAEGVLRSTRRVTAIHVHKPDAGDVPKLFEMGIPVVELDDGFPFHVDVQQRVPLNQDRDNVTPAYLRKLRVAVLNAVHAELDAEQASTPWVADASGDDDVEDVAVESVMERRFGRKRVVYDPSDPEGSKLAMSKGYTVIPGNSLSRGQWRQVRRSGAALPAGQVTPSPKVRSSPDGVKPVPRAEWDSAWVEVTELARHLWLVLRPNYARGSLNVRWYDSRGLNFSGAWTEADSGSQLLFNAAALGGELADMAAGDRRGILALIVHEFGHAYESDHLSEAYHDALCRMAAEAFYVELPPASAVDAESPKSNQGPKPGRTMGEA